MTDSCAGPAAAATPGALRYEYAARLGDEINDLKRKLKLTAGVTAPAI